MAVDQLIKGSSPQVEGDKAKEIPSTEQPGFLDKRLSFARRAQAIGDLFRRTRDKAPTGVDLTRETRDIRYAQREIDRNGRIYLGQQVFENEGRLEAFKRGEIEAPPDASASFRYSLERSRRHALYLEGDLPNHFSGLDSENEDERKVAEQRAEWLQTLADLDATSSRETHKNMGFVRRNITLAPTGREARHRRAENFKRWEDPDALTKDFFNPLGFVTEHDLSQQAADIRNALRKSAWDEFSKAYGPEGVALYKEYNALSIEELNNIRNDARLKDLDERYHKMKLDFLTNHYDASLIALKLGMTKRDRLGNGVAQDQMWSQQGDEGEVQEQDTTKGISASPKSVNQETSQGNQEDTVKGNELLHYTAFSPDGKREYKLDLSKKATSEEVVRVLIETGERKLAAKIQERAEEKNGHLSLEELIAESFITPRVDEQEVSARREDEQNGRLEYWKGFATGLIDGATGRTRKKNTHIIF